MCLCVCLSVCVSKKKMLTEMWNAKKMLTEMFEQPFNFLKKCLWSTET